MEEISEGKNEAAFDILLQLPRELSVKVLTYLTGKELSTVCRVSRSWREIANYNLLWKKLCIRESLFDGGEVMKSECVLKRRRKLVLECKWAKVYHEKRKIHSNWAHDNYTWWDIKQEMPTADVYHNILALVYWTDVTPTIDILDINASSLDKLQTLSLPFNVAPQIVGVCINASVLTIELNNISVIYNCDSTKFIYEVLVVSDLKMVCSAGEEQEFVNKFHTNDKRCWTLCLAGRYIWFQTSSGVNIYDRNKKTFKHMDDIVQVVVHVEIHGEMVLVQCPHSVQVFYEDGKLLYTYSAYTKLFYTGLVMSPTSFAFLQAEDFGDPHVVQVTLGTWQVYKETQLMAYRIALHQNILLLLSQDPFTLTSMSQGEINWSKIIKGTKYLQPGKDVFKVICSKYLFVCPSLSRLNMFSLYNVNNGDHLYDTLLYTSSYNIQTISDYCIVSQSKKSTINIRVYV